MAYRFPEKMHFRLLTYLQIKCIYALIFSIHFTKKIKFSIMDFFSTCDQIRSLLKKSLLENLIFCAVKTSVIKRDKHCTVISKHLLVQNNRNT